MNFCSYRKKVLLTDHICIFIHLQVLKPLDVKTKFYNAMVSNTGSLQYGIVHKLSAVIYVNYNHGS